MTSCDLHDCNLSTADFSGAMLHIRISGKPTFWRQISAARCLRGRAAYRAPIVEIPDLLQHHPPQRTKGPFIPGKYSELPVFR